MAQLWAKRFNGHGQNLNARFTKINCSLPIDARLFADDIDASKAWAEALERAGYLKNSECEQILGGLELVRYDWIERLIKFLPTDEDVHTVNERRLTEIIGEIGQRLHTGRSRNDQVVTDLKLWLRKAIRETCAGLCQVIEAAVQQAEKNLLILMPGYVHLQRVQPIQFSHWMLSYAFALREDCLRLCELKERCNVLPLGSGALAGNPLGIDRIWLAERLGFNAVTENSIHAVGDRDFVTDFIYCCSVASLHLSRLAEDLILYSTKEFNFIEINDEFSTGSNLLPQKCNPESMELVRGISSCICASLTGLMMTIKGMPSSYNKDLQFDKKFCFDAFDGLQEALGLTEGVIRTLKLRRESMEEALQPDMLTKDWAYYLVRKGVPFRRAHKYMGEVVALGEEMGVELTDIPLEDLQRICPQFDTDIAQVADYSTIVEQYNSIGGTATESIEQQLSSLKMFLNDMQQLH